MHNSADQSNTGNMQYRRLSPREESRRTFCLSLLMNHRVHLMFAVLPVVFTIICLYVVMAGTVVDELDGAKKLSAKGPPPDRWGEDVGRNRNGGRGSRIRPIKTNNDDRTTATTTEAMDAGPQPSDQDKQSKVLIAESKETEPFEQESSTGTQTFKQMVQPPSTRESVRQLKQSGKDIAKTDIDSGKDMDKPHDKMDYERKGNQPKRYPPTDTLDAPKVNGDLKMLLSPSKTTTTSPLNDQQQSSSTSPSVAAVTTESGETFKKRKGIELPTFVIENPFGKTNTSTGNDTSLMARNTDEEKESSTSTIKENDQMPTSTEGNMAQRMDNASNDTTKAAYEVTTTAKMADGKGNTTSEMQQQQTTTESMLQASTTSDAANLLKEHTNESSSNSSDSQKFNTTVESSTIMNDDKTTERQIRKVDSATSNATNGASTTNAGKVSGVSTTDAGMVSKSKANNMDMNQQSTTTLSQLNRQKIKMAASVVGENTTKTADVVRLQ